VSPCCASGVPNWCVHIENLVMPVGNIACCAEGYSFVSLPAEGKAQCAVAACFYSCLSLPLPSLRMRSNSGLSIGQVRDTASNFLGSRLLSRMR